MIVTPKISHKEAVAEGGKLTEAKKEGKMILKPVIEAIHAGKTRNGNVYPAEKLKGDFKEKSGVYSFLYPYPKPMLKNHDQDSEPTGRVKNAKFVTDSATGRECVLIIPEITDQETIEKILDGRYLTVSIGATTNAAICSVCGQDIIKDGWCGHERGETYDGIECNWIVGDIWFDECSWVNVPADSDAMVRDMGEPTVMEAYAQIDDKYYNLSADDDTIEVKESVAAMLGIKSNIENPKEGGQESVPDNMISLEEHNKVVEEKQALETQIAEKDGVIAEKDGLIAEKDTQLAEKDTQIAEKDAAIATMTTTISEKDQAIADKDTEIADLKDKLATAEGATQTLTDEVAELKAASHKDLAERVVEMKVTLGKVAEDAKETELVEHVARTAESLKDALADLMKEFTTGSPARQLVPNPGLGAKPGEPGSTIEGVDDKHETKLTTEEVLKNLFSGLRK
jgi:hypothetical protein